MSVGDIWHEWRCLAGDYERLYDLGWTAVRQSHIPSLEEPILMIEWDGDGPPQTESLIPDGIMREVNAVFFHGARKHNDPPGERAWRSRPDEVEESYKALLRHLKDYRNGVTADKDSGQHPLAHVIARASILFDLAMQTKARSDEPMDIAMDRRSD